MRPNMRSMEWHFTRGDDQGRKSKIALLKSDRKLLQTLLDLRQPERRERTQADANAFDPFQDLGQQPVRRVRRGILGAGSGGAGFEGRGPRQTALQPAVSD